VVENIVMSWPKKQTDLYTQRTLKILARVDILHHWPRRAVELNNVKSNTELHRSYSHTSSLGLLSQGKYLRAYEIGKASMLRYLNTQLRAQ